VVKTGDAELACPSTNDSNCAIFVSQMTTEQAHVHGMKLFQLKHLSGYSYWNMKATLVKLQDWQVRTISMPTLLYNWKMN